MSFKGGANVTHMGHDNMAHVHLVRTFLCVTAKQLPASTDVASMHDLQMVTAAAIDMGTELNLAASEQETKQAAAAYGPQRFKHKSGRGSSVNVVFFRSSQVQLCLLLQP